MKSPTCWTSEGDQFKRVAYRKAAHNIEALTKDIAEYQGGGAGGPSPGVGKAIAQKVDEVVDTGHLEDLEDVRRQEFPPGLLRCCRCRTSGRKTAADLYKELEVRNLEELKEAAQQHRLHDLKGFGEKTRRTSSGASPWCRGRPAACCWATPYPTAEAVAANMRDRAGCQEVAWPVACGA